MIKSVAKQGTGLLLALALGLVCSGCGRAPSVDIIGSFFPVWMVCLTVGIVLTFGVRYLLLHYKIEQEVGSLALFYPCSVILLTSLLWLIFYR
jgi:hypothetical protein